MEERTFRVESIHCGGCERAIREGLGEVAGVDTATPDAGTNTVAVRFDATEVGEQQIHGRLVELGFPPVTAEEPGNHDGGARGLARYLLLVVAVAAVAVAGYMGYVLFPRFDLPAAEGVAVLGLAAAAGVASFFSPCSFPLLLSLLGGHASARARGEPSSTRPVVFGGALAAGAGAFLVLAGVAIAAGGGVLFEQVTFDSTAGITLRLVIGVLLVGLGLVQVGALPSPFHALERTAQPMLRRQARLRRQHPVAGYGLLGFGYVLAGFG
jgi:cytochrome c biogenesis protein CcdA/copper chaperone CopZ